MADGQESRTASRKVRGGLAFWSLLLPESGEGDEVRLESFHRSKWKRPQEPKGPGSENKGEVETNVERKGGHRKRQSNRTSDRVNAYGGLRRDDAGDTIYHG
ncbi:hypothetical protein ZEAMMB73_Zm00001d020110 [Zea mays]|uniref:Uncharacterized protein n=1 Tax=Zea mays TaxID=4577 RepID=A0A1D6I271_MAIZE|nr:hypothetical protein ZEAMMB73_Zm00001d020110 [Zea mays]